MRATLSVEVIGDLLVISISADALAFAVNSSKYAQPLDDGGEYLSGFEVSDSVGFAKDVARELERTGKRGSTLVTRMLDAAAQEAVEQGSEHISRREEEEE